jgi:hypothetical protein
MIWLSSVRPVQVKINKSKRTLVSWVACNCLKRSDGFRVLGGFLPVVISLPTRFDVVLDVTIVHIGVNNSYDLNQGFKC